MTTPLHHPNEPSSDAIRDHATVFEPKALRTYTPTQAVIARSAGIFFWTPEGRRLYDFTSGVLVANLGHNPRPWMERFTNYMGWGAAATGLRVEPKDTSAGYSSALPLSTYNAITSVETEASRRLVALLRDRSGGRRLEQVMWAASGS